MHKSHNQFVNAQINSLQKFLDDNADLSDAQQEAVHRQIEHWEQERQDPCLSFDQFAYADASADWED